MTTRHTPPLSFDARSLMLIAALTLGGPGALQAQTATAPPKATSPLSVGPATGPDIGPTAGSAPSARTVFDRADTNQDGQLSEPEAVRLPAVHQRFKVLDTDNNGSLSRAEFDKGTQP